MPDNYISSGDHLHAMKAPVPQDEVTLEAVNAYLKATSKRTVIGAPIPPVTSGITNTIDLGGGNFSSARMSLPANLDGYSEDEIRALRDLCDQYLPPTPPKFTSEAEADAWMEEHYG